MKTRSLIVIALLLSLVPGLAGAYDVDVSIETGKAAWDEESHRGDEDLKPTVRWMKDVLVVKSLETGESDYVILAKDVRVKIQDENLFIIYQTILKDCDLKPSNPGGAVFAGTCFPVLMEFKIYGLPHREYTVKVSSETIGWPPNSKR